MMRFEYPGVTRDQAMRWRLKRIFGAGDDDNEIATPANGARDHHVSRLADLLCEASDGEVDRPAALRWLLHHRDGRALVAQYHKHEKGLFPMQDRSDELEAVVKRHGSFTGLCKAVAVGRSRGISERELSLCATGFAMNRFPELTPEQAFAKAYGDARSSGEARAFWDATETLKQAAFTSDHVDDEDEEDDDEENGQEIDALGELHAKAVALRKRMPHLSEAQAFTKAYEQNSELAKRERRQNGF